MTSRSIVLSVLLLCASARADCDESFRIDSTEYRIPDRWCGRAIDSSMLAAPDRLVRVPDQQTFEDYRIYVLPDARDAFVRMARAALRDNITLIIDSGYRSARYQRKIIRRRLEQGESITTILKSVAPPGYSEHETGRAVDLVPSEAAFAHTDAYRWLKEHAAEFNFYETIPRDSSGRTSWESWHWMFHPESAH